jgi:hypothetical protein
MTTASGRASLALRRVKFFAVGRIGADAHVSPGERALLLILREHNAASILLEVLRHGRPAGQVYALLGLRNCGYDRIESLLQSWRDRTEQVHVQTGCLRSLQPLSYLVSLIEKGAYSRLFESYETG